MKRKIYPIDAAFVDSEGLWSMHLVVAELPIDALRLALLLVTLCHVGIAEQLVCVGCPKLPDMLLCCLKTQLSRCRILFAS